MLKMEVMLARRARLQKQRIETVRQQILVCFSFCCNVQNPTTIKQKLRITPSIKGVLIARQYETALLLDRYFKKGVLHTEYINELERETVLM